MGSWPFYDMVFHKSVQFVSRQKKWADWVIQKSEQSEKNIPYMQKHTILNHIHSDRNDLKTIHGQPLLNQILECTANIYNQSVIKVQSIDCNLEKSAIIDNLRSLVVLSATSWPQLQQQHCYIFYYHLLQKLQSSGCK